MPDMELRLATDDEKARRLDCLRCGFLVHPHGTMTVRTGGVGGGWSLLIGDLADIGEATVDLNAYLCPNCGHVEFRLPDRDRA
jgi:hypothetical protein